MQGGDLCSLRLGQVAPHSAVAWLSLLPSAPAALLMETSTENMTVTFLTFFGQSCPPHIPVHVVHSCCAHVRATISHQSPPLPTLPGPRKCTVQSIYTSHTNWTSNFFNSISHEIQSQCESDHVLPAFTPVDIIRYGWCFNPYTISISFYCYNELSCVDWPSIHRELANVIPPTPVW